MSQRNPPAEIVSLGSIIGAAECWTEYSKNRILWAEALPDEIPDAGPTAVMMLRGQRQFRILLLGGAEMSESDLHTLAQSLAFQIQSRYRLDMTGLHIPKEPTVGEIGEPSEAMMVAGDNTHAVAIDGSYGISID